MMISVSQMICFIAWVGRLVCRHWRICGVCLCDVGAGWLQCGLCLCVLNGCLVVDVGSLCLRLLILLQMTPIRVLLLMPCLQLPMK